MSDSIYRTYGLHNPVSTELINGLKKKHRGLAGAKKRQGIFLGISFLEDLVKDLKAGHFDGIVVNYGVAGSGPTKTFELVATQLELKGGDSHDIIRKGINYTSTPVDNTNPPDVGSPPIGGTIG